MCVRQALVWVVGVRDGSVVLKCMLTDRVVSNRHVRGGLPLSQPVRAMARDGGCFFEKYRIC